MSIRRSKPNFVKVYFICAVLLVVLTSHCLAIEPDQDLDYPQKKQARSLMISEYLDAFQISGGFFAGFDNNVYLSSPRKEDSFEEALFNVNYKFDLDAGIQGKLTYDLFSMIYNSENDATVIDNDISLELTKDFNRLLRAGFRYDLEPVIYPNCAESQYIRQGPSTFLRHNITNDIYQQLSYEFSTYDYTDRHIFDSTGKLLTTKRFDQRHTLDYDLGFYLSKNVLLKFNGEYLVNDSNEKFLDFYDYSSYRGGVSLYLLLNPRISGFISFDFTRRLYDSRLVATGSNKQRDSIYNPNMSIDYKISKNISLVLLYSYRKSNSNEPEYSYSGSVVSLGIMSYY